MWEWTEWGYLPENLSINVINKNFGSSLLFPGLSIEKCKRSQFLGCLIKIKISVLNFSTESAKKKTIYNLLFFTALCSPKNDNKQSSERKI